MIFPVNPPPPLNGSKAEIDVYWMQIALHLAEHAKQMGEVPVGAVLVKEGRHVATGFNQPISNNDPSAHAEIIALRQGAQVLGNYRLLNTTLYVTLEPCTMCVGAMVHARIQRVVFAAREPKTGAVVSQFQLLQPNGHNHQIEIEEGILKEQSSQLLKDFFKQRRKANQFDG